MGWVSRHYRWNTLQCQQSLIHIITNPLTITYHFYCRLSLKTMIKIYEEVDCRSFTECALTNFKSVPDLYVLNSTVGILIKLYYTVTFPVIRIRDYIPPAPLRKYVCLRPPLAFASNRAPPG